jgi:phosphate uptake regulator
MRKIDPTERALDAYFQLDTDQRATFALALKHVERFAATLGNSAAQAAPKPLGRPRGSKNRRVVIETNEGGDAAQRMFKTAAPTAQELELRHNNGAATEGL